MRFKASTLSVAGFLVIGSVLWAVCFGRTALFPFKVDLTAKADQQQKSRPRGSARQMAGTIRFREDDPRGLIADAWVNGAGRFEFALDTGVGTTLISSRAAEKAGIRVMSGTRVRVSGLSGLGNATGTEVVINSLALGDVDNVLSSHLTAIVTDSLPPGLDGILEPAEACRPYGLTLDLARNELSLFDARANPLRKADVPPDGAVVSWLSGDGSGRPFVMLDNGRRALLDTGSSLGLGIPDHVAYNMGISGEDIAPPRTIKDLGAGAIRAKRVRPITVSIGTLALRNVPTDIIGSTAPDAPIILGRDALRPFLISFDPVHRLILITPSKG